MLLDLPPVSLIYIVDLETDQFSITCFRTVKCLLISFQISPRYNHVRINFLVPTLLPSTVVCRYVLDYINPPAGAVHGAAESDRGNRSILLTVAWPCSVRS